MKRLAPAAISAVMLLLISGCCYFKRCDCSPPVVAFALSDSGSYCAGVPLGHTRVKQYDPLWNLIKDVAITSSSCGVEAPWNGSPYYLIFVEETLMLSDTVQVISIDQADGTKTKCCDCPGEVLGLEYNVNGVAMSAVGDTVELGF